MNREIFRPPPDLSISEWADTYRYLSLENSPEAGKWRTSRAEYQRGMMDAVKEHERVVIMTAAQVGKTELLLNTLGYYIHYDPCPILIIQPTLEMGEKFSKDKLAPMLRDTPVLRERVGDPKSRKSGNTLRHKQFPGGSVDIAGANSPAGLASLSIRVLLCDEVDRYPESAGTEGSPVHLAMKRTVNFWNRKIIQVSTPTIKGEHGIEEAFSLSDKSEWLVPCPTCGEYQPYSWGNMLYQERTEPVMKCPHCGHEHNGAEWKRGLGRWESTAESAIKGFHLNAFASSWVSWGELVRDYYEAYNSGPDALKVWHNTVLGEPWDNPEGVIDIETLRENCIDYGEFPDGRSVLPEGVLILTAGVDTQDDRLECEVVGWGLRNQTWGVEYKVLYGDPSDSGVWKDLDEFLSGTWEKLDGERLTVACTCVDSAGHNTDAVYKYCRVRSGKRIYPIVGRGQWGMPSVKRPAKRNKERVLLFTLGVSTIKGTLHTRLHAAKGEPGCCYFPLRGRGYTESYFNGLLSERMVIKRQDGREVVRWEERDRHTRNEPLDCRVYAMGAYEILSPDLSHYVKGECVKNEGLVPVKKVKRRMMRRGVQW